MKVIKREFNKYFSNKLIWYNFILSLMIVSYHAFNVGVYDLGYNFGNLGKILYNIEVYISAIQTVAVPTFFIISGFLFFYTFSLDKLLYKYKKRFYSLLIPYIIWNTISFIYYMIITNIPFIQSKMSMGVIELNMENIFEGIIMGKYNALWFIRVLMCLVLIAPFIYYFTRNKKRGLALIVLLISIHFKYYTDEFSLLYCSAFYIFGSYISIHYKEYVIQKHEIKVCILSSIIFFIISLLLMNTEYLNNIPLRQLLLLIYCTTFWIAGDLIDFPMDIPWYVRISFFIYCTHGPILEGIEKIFLIVFGKTFIGALLDYLFAPIITVIIIIILAWILKSYFTNAWNICTGRR